VLRTVASGKTVSQIGGQLHLGTTTIISYRARIVEKMNRASESGLISYAVRNCLVEWELSEGCGCSASHHLR
jgi:DNA-binding NarL/FixJ family response regulator